MPAFSIVGERCSGTNFLVHLIKENLKIEHNQTFHKHTFLNAKFSDDIIYVGIIREVYEWANSSIKNPHHMEGDQLKDIKPGDFHDGGLKGSRDMITHLKTGKQYKNIIQLRADKLDFLLNTAPKQAKNYILVRYEDVVENNEKFLKEFASRFSLEFKHEYPNKIKSYFKGGIPKGEFVKSDKYVIDKNDVYKHPDFNKEIEKQAGYQSFS